MDSNRQKKILESLRKKLMLKRGLNQDSSDDDPDPPSAKMSKYKKKKVLLSGNTNAAKATRKIELGWLNFANDYGYTQVRSKRGGGTRKIDINKDANAKDILVAAKCLFFKNGESPCGKIDDFEFHIRDFSESLIESEEETVAEMYSRTALRMLRFYMATKHKTEYTNKPPTTTQKASATVTSVPSSPEQTADDDECFAHYDLDDINILPDLDTTAEATIIPLSPGLDKSDEEVVFNFKYSTQTTTSAFPASLSPESLLLDIPVFGQSDYSHIDRPSSEYSTTVGEETEADVNGCEMVIHRGVLAFTELCGYFKDASLANKRLTIVRVLPNGEKEMAEDTGGVLRDLLAEFWSEFYDKCTLGKQVKVPSLRHDFGFEEWCSIGRVLLYGWQRAGYWPTSISKEFFRFCLFPKCQSQSGELIPDFKNFIPETDREVFESALNNFKEVDMDELLDVLESHDCRSRVTSENFKCILNEIAHKELIQMPMFVINCWRDVMKNALENESKLDEIYSSLLPTNRRVLKMLTFPEGDMSETGKHLKRYVKELSPEKLGLFLRFCTGADLITVPCIKIDYVDLQGLARRPVSHTCGCVLELSDNYDNYMDFRTEFNGVLSSSVWIMDIV